MVKFIKNGIGDFLTIVLVFTLITGWMFSGWPQIWQNPRTPPGIQEVQAATETFITAGTFTNGWTAPDGVFSVTAETWAGGGGSGGGTVKTGPGGSGGGGGAYASKVISVTPGNSYTYVVGAAGLKDGGTAGGNSSFTGNASVQSLACGGTSGAADGGTAGAGGTTLCSDGTTEFAGGAGAAGAGTSGGGGGESAGTTATGGSASGTTGGTGTDGTDGSAGQLVDVNGVAGNNPGAGAGGSGGRSGGMKSGASGGVGQVQLTYAAITAALTGTVTESITEADIVTGGKTIILTLTNDTWVDVGATFDGQRQNIINGIDSAQAEGTGWDAEVKAKEVVEAVVRTNDTVVTITLTAQGGYNITATETITATIPATALVAGNAIVATPTFTIDAVAATVSCDADPVSIAFPTLTISAVETANGGLGNYASTTMSCTYSGGCTLSVYSAGDGNNPGLATSSPAYLIQSVTETLVAGSEEGYGLQATTTAVGSGGTLAIDARFDKTDNDVGAMASTSPYAQVASSTQAVSNREILVTHKAAITSLTQAANYDDTITYTCTGN